jgi:two-component system CheB/CheR fusion protein
MERPTTRPGAARSARASTSQQGAQRWKNFAAPRAERALRSPQLLDLQAPLVRHGRGTVLATYAESGEDDPWAGDTGGVTETSGPAITEPRAASAVVADVHVLVVDGDPDSRRILQAVLEYGGAVVSVTATAREALAVMERVHADVILTDLALSSEDGYWLVRHVREWPIERGGGVPVVAITTADAERASILAAGFSEHLRKPIAIDVLYRILGSVSGRRRRH